LYFRKTKKKKPLLILEPIKIDTMHLRFNANDYFIVKDKESERFFAILKSDVPNIRSIAQEEEFTCISISRNGDLEEGFTKLLKWKNLDNDLWIEGR